MSSRVNPKVNPKVKDKIYVFAMVWMQMYRNHANIPFSYFEDHIDVGNWLEELGFSMDCGKSLE